MQNEQLHLHSQLQELRTENDLINSKLEDIKLATSDIAPTAINTEGGESGDNATREKLTTEALNNVQKQFEFLQTENTDLRTLNKTLKKTIENLENEILSYRNQLFKPTSSCEFKQKYGTAIKLLENTVQCKNLELKERSQLIENLSEQKKELYERIARMEKLLEEKSAQLEKFGETKETISKLEEQLSLVQSHNNELQKSLKVSNQVIETKLKREQKALQKVQEALTIAEAAEADKQEALRRERIVKEECDNIASTIGHVMDETARKVEQDMEAIKHKYIEKEKNLNELQNKLYQEIQNQKKYIQILETRCQRYQQKYMAVEKENGNLSDQLEQAAKALWNLEEKVKKLELQSNEDCLQKISMDQNEQIEEFVKKNHHLRERYNSIINELTENFEQKMYSLQEEILRLKAKDEATKLEQNI